MACNITRREQIIKIKLRASALYVFFICQKIVAKLHTEIADKDIIGASDEAINLIMTAPAKRAAMPAWRIAHLIFPSLLRTPLGQ
jgi:hypothetical protein